MRNQILAAFLLLPATAFAQIGGAPAGPAGGGEFRGGIHPVPPPPPVPSLGLGEFTQPPRPDQLLNKPTNDALDKPLDKLSLSKTPLKEALDRFAKDAHLSVRVNWQALETVGVDANTPVTLELPPLPARKMLPVILAQAGATANLRFLVDTNQVVVSSADDLMSSKYQAVIVYDLRPLFADWESDNPQAITSAEGILDTLRSAVAPDTWRDNGGTIGTAKIFNGQLIVNQTYENHDRITDLFRELGAGNARPTRAYDIRDLIKDAAPAPAPQPAGPVQAGTPPPLPPKVQSLITAIQVNCGRDTWRDLGGKTSSVAYFDGKLYITTRGAIHDQIEGLLALMRK